MIERNDPCPCGSGKKYKKCCVNKKFSKNEIWKQRSLDIGSQYPNNEVIANTFFAVFNHSIEKNGVVLVTVFPPSCISF